jgi:hypothetical protein
MASRKAGQGSRWIWVATRYAIYARDGFSCVYCERHLKIGYSMTLDHVKPATLGGSNGAGNLVTCCRSCNDYKKDLSVKNFLAWLEANGVDVAGVAQRVRRQLRKPIDRAEGRRLVKLRSIVVAKAS